VTTPATPTGLESSFARVFRPRSNPRYLAKLGEPVAGTALP